MAATTIGWCAPIEQSARVARNGYDFIEAALGPMQLETDDGMADALTAVERAAVPVAVFNQLLPRDMMLVGPAVEPARIRRYITRVASVVAAASGQVVVLGSGWARNVPEGWRRDVADAQFLETVLWFADALAPIGATLALEAQNLKETNFVTTLAEAARMAQALGGVSIGVVADTYHLHESGELLAVVAAVAGVIAHIHVSDSDRRLPGDGAYDFAAFFRCLNEGGYQGRLSIEMMRDVSDEEMHRALAFVRTASAF